MSGENGMNVVDRLQNGIPFPSGAMSVAIETAQVDKKS